MGLMKTDHKKQLITLSVITLSSFHCIKPRSKEIKFKLNLPEKYEVGLGNSCSQRTNIFLFAIVIIITTEAWHETTNKFVVVFLRQKTTSFLSNIVLFLCILIQIHNKTINCRIKRL